MRDDQKKTGGIESLSPLEKTALLSGLNTWQSRPIPRLGIRSLFMADGPHGVRKQVGSADHLGINASQPATCFPTAATVASSWDLELAEQIGSALGVEAAAFGVDVLLGPGLNIKRSPLGGRNFEYFSEDPYLSGKFGAGFVRGIQSAGVAACPKHFAVNSQETRRMTSNSVVDAGTLHDIYLTGFEITVKEGRPLAIMSSYNLVNGTYAHENSELLQHILRDQWGFDGAVITDWGGGNDAAAAIAAGGTVEMPSPGFDSVRQLLGSQNLDQEALDRRVSEMIELVRRIQPVPVDGEFTASHHTLARVAAEQSIILLRNESELLPLKPGTRVAVVGKFAFEPRYQGAGSSLVNATQVDVAVEELRRSPLDVVGEAVGFEHGRDADPLLIDEAVTAATAADVVLLYLGLDEITESEGMDRENLRIPQAQLELLRALALTDVPIAVILSAGSVVELPWLEQCQALLHGYLGGQAGASAAVKVLTGEVNPSGRLAETYPLILEDTPTASTFPSREWDALYREGPFVGYRYYTSADQPVRFPFGFGLSYTTFAYSELEVTDDGVSFVVSNTGTRAGAEVAQLYVGPPAVVRRMGPTPTRSLKGFTKVFLEPGESTRVRIAFDDYTFRTFDTASGQWVTVAGDYEISVARNAEVQEFSATLRRKGVAAPAPTPASEIANYAAARVHHITDEEFAVLLGRQPRVEVQGTTPLGANSPLSDMEHARSPLARFIYRRYLLAGLKRAERKGKPNLNLLFQYGMPFRAIAKMSGGLADSTMVDSILTIVNGSFFRGFGQTIRRFFSNRRIQKDLRQRFESQSQGSPSQGSSS